MIKTYVYTKPMNNVSHVITDIGGNTVRFNFTNGNTFTKKLPELTLTGKYYQDVLDNSELVAKGLVRCTRTVAEESDAAETKEDEETTATNSDGKEEVLSVTSTDEVIAYVNERFGKEYRNLASAMKCATQNNLVFPNYKP